MVDERDDRWLEALGAGIRESAAPDPAAEARVMAKVRAEAAAPRAGGFWAWLVRPRMVPVSPLAAATVAVGLMLAAFAWVRGPFRTTAPGPGAPTAGPEVRDDAGLASLGARPVQFVIVSPGASRVSVVGDFNNWEPGRTPLARSASGGVWSVTVPLPPGVYAYAYLVDGRLRPAEDEPSAPRDEFGSSNSVLVVGKEML